MTNAIGEATNLIVATNDAVSCDLEGEAVILHLASESYFGLNQVGTTVWEFIQQARTFDEICDHLMAEYEVPREQCQSEVSSLIDAMKEQGLAEIVKHAP